MIRSELIHFVQTYQRTFSFNISGTAAGFDLFAQW